MNRQVFENREISPHRARRVAGENEYQKEKGQLDEELPLSVPK